MGDNYSKLKDLEIEKNTWIRNAPRRSRGDEREEEGMRGGGGARSRLRPLI
jgi:hypothetical protein